MIISSLWHVRGAVKMLGAEVSSKELKSLERKAIEKFVYGQVYLPDGQAAKRIAELILSMTTRQG